MKDDGDEKGDEIASGGDGEGQSNENGMEDDTGLENGDAEFLDGFVLCIELATQRGRDEMVVTVMRSIDDAIGITVLVLEGYVESDRGVETAIGFKSGVDRGQVSR
jgi:hypothetical protein